MHEYEDQGRSEDPQRELTAYLRQIAALHRVSQHDDVANDD